MSPEAPDQGQLSDEDTPYEDPAEQTGSNEEIVPSEQDPEEAAEEGSNEETDETLPENTPEQEGSPSRA